MNDSDRLMELAARYADGAATAEEVRTLEEALRSDAAFRRQYLRYMNVDTVLGSVGAEREPAPMPMPKRGRIGWALSSLAALAAVLAISVSIWRQRTGSAGVNPGAVAAPAASLALLTATTDARWSDPNMELSLNSGELPAGVLRLLAGRVEFVMVDGAKVAMQGPVAFRFADRKRIVVSEGRIVCDCPTPESRVTVITPQTEIVDLGTVFSVEARADQSTRVEVLSGEVEVKGAQPQRLHKGDAVEVKKSTVVRLAVMSPEESERLARTWGADVKPNGDTPNRLLDPGFEQGLQSDAWHGTDECVEWVASGGRSGGAVRVNARSHRFWPRVTQDVVTGDIAGKVVAASVWASTPGSDRMLGPQHAILKLAFLDVGGREFACATRHFLNADAPRDQYRQATVAATAPVGTRRIQVQLMLNASGLKNGSVLFDDASLVIGDAPEAARKP